MKKKEQTHEWENLVHSSLAKEFVGKNIQEVCEEVDKDTNDQKS